MEIGEILDRYAVCADVLGRKKDSRRSKDPNAYPAYEQEGYSTAWFFKEAGDGAGLNDLTRAFLGDAAARSRLRFGAAEAASFEGHLLEGDHPLNASQRRAVARALESDVSLVQGPPGTGKTKTILNMVSCMLARGATVAVVANNGKAIDNVREQVEGWGPGSGAGPNQRRMNECYARLGRKDLRREWVRRHPDAPECLRFADCGWEPTVRAEVFLASYPFVTSTIHSLKKCFADGRSHQYDYVIMDEASQCSPLLGLIAMSAARHLVLVGDDEQLPPIHSEEQDLELRSALAERGLDEIGDARYALADAETGTGRSVLLAMRLALGDDLPSTLLNEHYRCHPGIIGFCTEAVYAPVGKELQVRTPDDGRGVRVPIRVRWFEGNYCERVCPEDGGERGYHKLSRTNARQLEVFMREEWPELRRRMGERRPPSVCVLSPYRGLLAELGERLAREGVDPAETTEGTGDDPLVAPEVPALTIHKSQGQEFDMVYLLPGEDGSWEWPWTEARSLINVAVSRARRELVIVASSCLMGVDVQAALVGEDRVVEPYQRDMSEEERERRKRRELYLQKLVDYARERNDPARDPDAPSGFPESSYDYGFHRTALRSVFDVVARLRREAPHRWGADDWATERALERAFEGVDLAGRGLGVRRGVRLAECFDASDERLAGAGDPARVGEFLASDAHFDFVVHELATGRMVLAIEVDGAPHRTLKGKATEQTWEKKVRELRLRRENDALKDAMARALGARVLATNRRAELERCEVERPAFTLLRLPTDGSCAFEVEALLDGAPAGAADDFVTIEELLDETGGRRF